ncbi:MAG: tetratricopeptide repeat protein [Pseudomonadota bacterium]
MRQNWLAFCLIATTIAACAPAGGVRTSDNPFPPAGRVDIDEAVDGLIVGHRLMAVGQYELALKAYFRAAGDQGLTVDVLSALGSANLRLGRLGQAEDLLRRAIAEDEEFPAAWNNLGVVLMERGAFGEASRVFRTAFALDSGESAEIRDNLALAVAKRDNPDYVAPDNNGPQLVRRGSGRYILLDAPV